MAVAAAVFDALELEEAPMYYRDLKISTGLSKDSLLGGLRTLKRCGLLTVITHSCMPNAYALEPGAVRPRPSPVHARRALLHYSPASSPSHAAAPGGARLVAKNILDGKRTVTSAISPAWLDLDRLWRKR